MSEKNTNKTAILSIVAFLVGTLLGPGFIWNWKQTAISEQKQRIDDASATTDLRSKENDLYNQIIALQNEYNHSRAEYERTPTLDARSEMSNEMVQQKLRLNMLKDNFTALEGKLAILESRAPRNIPLNFETPSAVHLENPVVR